jgi:hypothetical protein
VISAIESSNCDAMASSMYANSPGLTDAQAAARETWLYDTVFQPYEAALGAGYAGYFGTITRRASMQSCINYAGGGANIPGATTGIQPGQKDWVGNPMSVS